MNILTDHSAPVLSAGIKANLHAFFKSFHRSSLARVSEIPQGFRWHTDVAHPWFNGVFCSSPPADESSRTIQATLDYFRSQGVSMFTWWLDPELDPSAWSEYLLPVGFHYDNNTPGMALDLSALPPLAESPLVLQCVEDRLALSIWAETFARGYGIPESMIPGYFALIDSLGTDLPYRYYLGRLDGEPVATSMLFIGAGVAGIYNVATLADARGRGIGSSMTLAPLYDARDLGYQVAVLQSSEMGYPVYRHLGFQKYCQVDHFFYRFSH
jgi:GNAT superfamily N-acetyltransferase